MTQQTDDTVRVQVTVDAPIERAFAVFTERFDSWWPRGHHLGDGDLVAAVIEPEKGGRWYERTADGKECDWGHVLEWDPPHHVALSWDIKPAFDGVDPERASRIDVRFEADTEKRTTVTLVHSEFEKHGDDWQQLRNGVGADDGWGGILTAYVEAANA
ncbi:SRPBCC family protein [Tenggerimyces flavus]|uniref:SRPBCC family protein n=1 Tax=Tenggerimyces flavus TaxID=1708749 RepID=A0ABV7YH86_9ACTN|nr:SRPBCC family protein [Tenggerimyces flavus]MBM7786041.1 uncharacterized protein YndB with AHSA1/START domain [Tenggerimyces flavus]